MSGEIKHEWTGSVLTVISDSGASSADLKGPKGDTGPRGPQGPAGIILDEQGNIAIDLSPYDTSEEVDAKIQAAMGNVDLEDYATKAYVIEAVTNNALDAENYATKNYVSTEIAKAQLSGGSGTGEVDLSGYATKDDLANITVDIDNKTIVRDGDGKLRTALGGAEYITGEQIFTSNTADWVLDNPDTGGTTSTTTEYRIGTCNYEFVLGNSYLVSLVWADGTTTTEYYTYDNDTYGYYRLDYTPPGQNYLTYSIRVKNKDPYTVYYYRSGGFVKTDLVSLSIYDGEVGTVVEPIHGKFIPVDGETIIVNENGTLTAISGGANLDNYYTKSEIDALLAAIETYPSAEEVEY